MKLVAKIKRLFCTVVKKEIENVRIHVIHPYKSVPTYSMSWLEVVYVDGEVFTSNVKESHTAMCMGRQYTFNTHAELAACIDKLLAGR